MPILLFEDPKDPDDVADYGLDWSDRLEDDDIASALWIIDGPDAALVQESSELQGTKVALVWLSGGTEGSTYSLTCRVTTTGDRQLDQTVRLKVKRK